MGSVCLQGRMFSVQCCMECVVDWVHGLVLGGVGVFSGEDICVGMLTWS